MGFRRSKEQAKWSVLWKRFLADNAGLISRSGVPSSFFEDQRLFEDFLMHGYIDHHPDTTGFHLPQLDPEQRTAVAELAIEYLRIGLPDPGLMLFGSIIDDQIYKAARQE